MSNAVDPSRLNLKSEKLVSIQAVAFSNSNLYRYAAGSAKTRWKPFNRLKTLARVDIMHIDL